MKVEWIRSLSISVKLHCLAINPDLSVPVGVEVKKRVWRREVKLKKVNISGFVLVFCNWSKCLGGSASAFVNFTYLCRQANYPSNLQGFRNSRKTIFLLRLSAIQHNDGSNLDSAGRYNIVQSNCWIITQLLASKRFNWAWLGENRRVRYYAEDFAVKVNRIGERNRCRFIVTSTPFLVIGLDLPASFAARVGTISGQR